MKKGSKLRRCVECGKAIYWVIPNGYLYGIPTAKHRQVYPYKFVSRRGEICIDCLNKERGD